MFRQLALWFQEVDGATSDVALQVLQQHPAVLSRFLDEAWSSQGGAAGAANPPPLSYPENILINDQSSYLGALLAGASGDFYASAQPAQWEHLIYAYMIENTRIFEIFERVAAEYAHGERLGLPRPETQAWLRATEELFFRDPGPYSVTSVTSLLRPDMRAVRRNAYYRMFGMDLVHGAPGRPNYPYVKPQAANRRFVPVFEELLREVWKGIENSTNSSGPKPTDDDVIAKLARELRDMLTVRRGTPPLTLAREEFTAVAQMSWFHLTVEFDSPVVQDLAAQATSPDERLRKIGQRVGIPAHSSSRNYLQLATTMSRILLGIERGLWSKVATAPLLYRPGQAARRDMLTIIDHWSMATRRDMKARKVTPTPRSATPNGSARPARMTEFSL